jgi:Bifunctional DNA primase/polymerase, N-terminal
MRVRHEHSRCLRWCTADLCRARHCDVSGDGIKGASGSWLFEDGTRGLVIKFPDAPAIGFATKRRNGVTILDIDTPDEKVLADALNRHGRTPLIARTGSGKFRAYYRHNGERRRIRPWRGLAIDLLGTGGFVVAPPSEVAKGSYSFI